MFIVLLFFFSFRGAIISVITHPSPGVPESPVGDHHIVRRVEPDVRERVQGARPRVPEPRQHATGLHVQDLFSNRCRYGFGLVSNNIVTRTCLFVIVIVFVSCE